MTDVEVAVAAMRHALDALEASLSVSGLSAPGGHTGALDTTSQGQPAPVQPDGHGAPDNAAGHRPVYPVPLLRREHGLNLTNDPPIADEWEDFQDARITMGFLDR